MSHIISNFQVLLAVAAAGGAWLAWLLVRQFFFESPLDNIPGPKRASLIAGNTSQLFEKHCWPFLDELTDRYGGVVKLHGLLGKRNLWVADPLALHHVIIKDQKSYPLSDFESNLRTLVLGPGLLATVGDHHRRQRKLLTPVFSIANMRRLTPIFYETMHRLRQGITTRLCATGGQGEVDMLNWMGRAALELVGRGGLGYSFDPLVKNVQNEYGDALKELFPAATAAGLWHLIFLLDPYVPLTKLKRFAVAVAPNYAVRSLKRIADTMDKWSHQIYYDKRRALHQGDEALKQQVGEGKDIMSVLLRANMEAAEEDRLPEEEVIAQMSTLTFAGTDTTSNAVARILDILSQRQDVQDRLRAEIMDARNGQDIGYDDLVELPYLDAICRETLRLYPPVGSVGRESARDMILPLSEPIRGKDGSLVHEIIVPKHTEIEIGIYSCNRSKAIWGDDALEWKPERWLQRLPESILDAKVPGVYSNLMTFLGGARSCIGFKFSQLEMKVVLAVLLESFRFFPSGKEIVWNRSGVDFPTVGSTSDTPSLPLRVEFVKV